jgi:hypothetical protein
MDDKDYATLNDNRTGTSAGLPPGTAFPRDVADSPSGGRVSLRASLLRAADTGRALYESLPDNVRATLHLRERKTVSLRKLAASLGIPRSTLWRALAIYQLCDRYPEVREYHHVGVCHLSLVLGLDRDQQIFWLRRVERSRLSRGQLARAIRTARGRDSSLECGSAVATMDKIRIDRR